MIRNLSSVAGIIGDGRSCAAASNEEHHDVDDPRRSGIGRRRFEFRRIQWKGRRRGRTLKPPPVHFKLCSN